MLKLLQADVTLMRKSENQQEMLVYQLWYSAIAITYLNSGENVGQLYTFPVL